MADAGRFARRPGPARYSALALLRHAVGVSAWAPAWRTPDLKRTYEVVIVGGGSGRNTAILRSNYLTPEGVRFYDRSLELCRGWPLT